MQAWNHGADLTNLTAARLGIVMTSVKRYFYTFVSLYNWNVWRGRTWSGRYLIPRMSLWSPISVIYFTASHAATVLRKNSIYLRTILYVKDIFMDHSLIGFLFFFKPLLAKDSWRNLMYRVKNMKLVYLVVFWWNLSVRLWQKLLQFVRDIPVGRESIIFCRWKLFSPQESAVNWGVRLPAEIYQMEWCFCKNSVLPMFSSRSSK